MIPCCSHWRSSRACSETSFHSRSQASLQPPFAASTRALANAVAWTISNRVKVQMDRERNVLFESLAQTSLWMGETIYNLRSALDYLVYVLARAGKPSNVRDTQFPIEDTMDNFAGRITGKHPKVGNACGHT